MLMRLVLGEFIGRIFYILIMYEVMLEIGGF